MKKLVKSICLLALVSLSIFFVVVSYAETVYPCNGTVLKPDVNVRKEADSKSERVHQLEKNEKVTVLGEKKNGKTTWYHIEYAQKKKGYVRSDLINVESVKRRSVDLSARWIEAVLDEDSNQLVKPTSTPPAKKGLEFYDLSDKISYGYYTVSARVKNESSYRYRFVRVKAIFRDKNEEILDTNWTYLVTDEGLEPQESKTFSITVPYNKKIHTYEFTILDYEKDDK